MTTITDFSATRIDGTEQSLTDYAGQVTLVVNTASKCGFTPQFAGLEQLQQTYGSQGFTVLGFPCNQFANQDPGTNEEIGAFCQRKYDVSFPMFAKIDVNDLIIPVTFTRSVIALMGNRTRGIDGVVIVNEVLIAEDLAVRVQQKCRGVQIEIGAVGFTQVPSQTKTHPV